MTRLEGAPSAPPGSRAAYSGLSSGEPKSGGHQMPWPSVMVTAVPGLCGCRGPVFSGPVPILLHHVTDDRVDGPWAEVDGHGDVLGERLSQMMGGVYSPGAIRMAAGPAGSSSLVPA